MPIDIIFAGALILGFWQGYTRGIISTLVTILIYVFGISLSYKMASTTANILESITGSQNPLMLIAGFVLNLVVLIIILRQAAKGLEGLMELAYLGIVNQVMGGAVVAFVYVLAFSVLVWFANQGNLITQETLDQSFTYHRILEPLPGKAKNVVKRLQPMAKEMWKDSNKWMDGWRNYGIQRTESKEKVYELPEAGSGIEVDPLPDTRTNRPATRPAPPTEGDGIED